MLSGEFDSGRWGGLSEKAGQMVSDLLYYRRRVEQEERAALAAITPAARERRMALVESYRAKLAALGV